MTVVLDGRPSGRAARVAIYHRTEAGSRVPQVAVLNASGFGRLKQNADPRPPIPFGTSFVLGPAYWPASPDPKLYYHSPSLARLEIDTRELPNGPLPMRAVGTNGRFRIDYQMVLPPPTDRLTRLHVTQTYTATAAIRIEPSRRAERQGFKLVQASSMFLNEGGTCFDPLRRRAFRDCHDSNAARYVTADRIQRQVHFRNLMLPAFIFTAPRPLGSTWLDVLHTDDRGWQGNTPNVRIALDALPRDRTITPQGYVDSRTDPNDDNVGLWLHDDGPASRAWRPGQTGRIGYWLEARDDPPGR